jgi:hypothetical protein
MAHLKEDRRALEDHIVTVEIDLEHAVLVTRPGQRAARYLPKMSVMIFSATALGEAKNK